MTNYANLFIVLKINFYFLKKFDLKSFYALKKLGLFNYKFLLVVLFGDFKLF